MRRLAVRLTLCSLVLALAACSSAPIHFYTLMPPASPAASTVAAPYRIAVMPVTIPAQVDRPQFVVRTGTGSVALLEGERWIAPLADEIRDALSVELTLRLGAEDVYGVAHGGDVPVYRIRVDVRRLESAPGAYTRLSAVWSVQPAGGTAAGITCPARIRETVGPGYASVAQGHQRELDALAGTIAAAVRVVSSGHVATCAAQG